MVLAALILFYENSDQQCLMDAHSDGRMFEAHW